MSNRKTAMKKRGSALFMVICVMSIMLVVVMTAMAMVSLAYTRALQDYTASQSYITARNTLDMIVESGDNTIVTYDYGQSSLSNAQMIALNQPLVDVMMDVNTNFLAGNPIGGQVQYGTISSLPDEFGSCEFIDLSGSGEQIKYEVLADPNPSGSTYSWDLDGDTVTDDTTAYGQLGTMAWTLNPITGMEEQTQYIGCRVKLTVAVSSGVTESEQTRTVSKVFDAKYLLVQERSAGSPGSPAIPGGSGGGPFTQAIQTTGGYSGGTGMSILGGISAKGGGGSFDGLKGSTSSIYINGAFNPVDSGHNGTIDIGAGQSVVINGKFTVNNNFNFNSTYTSTSVGARPFIYCDEIDWSNSNIPVGEMDVIAVNGGTYGRDANSISGNLASGGNLTLKGNNVVISGTVFVDGNLDVSQSISNTSSGTIYISGSYDSSKIPSGVTVIKKDPGFLDLVVDDENTDSTTGVATISIPTSVTYSVPTDASVFGQLYENGNPTGTILGAESQFGSSLEVGSTSETVDVVNSPIEITVAEGDTTNIYLPEGTYSGLEIVVSGGGNVNIIQDDNVTLQGAKIWTDIVKSKVEAGEEIDMKTLADDPAYSMITWYVEEGKSLSLNSSASGDGNIINGYIYGPEADFYTVNGTPNGPTVTVVDEFGNRTSMKTCLLGSVIANNVSVCNGGPSIVYINPNGTSGGGSGGGGTPAVDPIPPGATSVSSVTFDLQSGTCQYTNRA